MWVGVTERFRRFHHALQLAHDDVTDGLGKQLGVRQSLQRAYWGPTTENPPGFIVGSWGKHTTISPPNDVDLFVPLPLDIFHRFEGYVGNKQSALLQEIKNHLLTTYPQTSMRGDGQVVVIAFNTLMIEVVPVFRGKEHGAWLMPDTNDGGHWRWVYPIAEIASLDAADIASSNNCRKLIQIIKAWRNHCNVPLKSFHIEQLVATFMQNYEYRKKDYFYYDWFVRDFLKFLLGQRKAEIYAPASNEIVSLGEEWFSRAVTAHDHAEKACEYEWGDLIMLAGDEWQKIFGPRIPSYVG